MLGFLGRMVPVIALAGKLVVVLAAAPLGAERSGVCSRCWADRGTTPATVEVGMYRQSRRLRTGAYVALVMACGFLMFYSLPDGTPFLVRLTTMVAAQWAVGKALQWEGMR